MFYNDKYVNAVVIIRNMLHFNKYVTFWNDNKFKCVEVLLLQKSFKILNQSCNQVMNLLQVLPLL